MASVTSEEQVLEYEDYIDQQIDRTSFQVKSVELIAGLIRLLLWGGGALGLLVLCDHWLLELSVGMRAFGLLVWLAGMAIVFVRYVARPLLQAVNPEYSALTVEQSFPQLHNALTSFLWFRGRPDGLRPAILAGLRQQTAAELHNVPIESAVDRSAIIRWGYALVAMTALWCGYLLFSPKNPLPSLQRILLPWSEIQRPSQVQILSVTPGAAEVFRGQTIKVEAHIQGLSEGEVPHLAYSTFDGQTVDRRIPLQMENQSDRFAAVLATGARGIQQDLRYRVVAGDATSREYDVLASSAPHLVVERLEYQYPAYTQLPPETIQGFGDVRALEGTRVTVIGRANQAIASGHIAFLLPEATAAQGAPPPSKQAALVVTEPETAAVTFTLRLDASRERSLYRAYRLHFLNHEGLGNSDPIELSLDVTPDLAPVVELISPQERTVNLPENGVYRIEVRAVDPDFQLTRVALAGRTRERALFRRPLLTENHRGQFTATFTFRPRDFGLQDGDVVEYQAMAEDNRHAPLRGVPEPNLSTSWKQYFRIVAADPAVDAETPEEQAPAEEGEPSSSGTDSTSTGQDSTAEGDQQQPKSESGDSSSDAAADEESSGGGAQGGAGLQQDGGSGSDAEQQELDSGSPGKSSGGESEQGTGTQNAGDQQGSESDPSSEPSGDNRNGGSDSEGGRDPETRSDPSPSASGDQEDPGAEPSGDGEGGEMSESNPGESPEPLPATGERDGEVIDRIRQHLEDAGEWDERAADLPSTQETPDASSETDDTGSNAEGADNATGSSDPSRQPSGQEAGRDAGNAGEEGNADSESSKEPSTEPSDDSAGESGEDSASEPQTSGQSPDSEGSTAGDQAGTEGSRGQPNDTQGAPSDEGDRQTDAAESTTDPGDAASDRGTGEQGADAKSSPSENAGEESSTGDDSSTPGDDAGSGPEAKPETSSNAGPQEASSGEAAGGEGGQESDPPQGVNEGDPAADADDEGAAGDAAAADSGGSRSGDAGSESRGDSSPGASQAGETQPGESETKTSSQEGTPGAAPSGGSSSAQSGADAVGEGPGGGAANGDEVNLEYAQQVTDLVLDYLSEQQRKPDPQLLEKLGWQPRDVDRFLRRWQDMKRQAAGTGSAARQAKGQLDDVLRQLKLNSRSPATRLRGGPQDRQPQNLNSGRRVRVPAELLDPFRAFQRSLNRQ